MPDFCTCGAQLPADARFCHKCGKPQGDFPLVETESVQEPVAPVIPPPLPPPEIGFGNAIAVRVGFVAALIGIVLVFFPLPFPLPRLMIGFMASGFLAVYLYIRRTGQRLSLLSGARIGWITGIFSFTMCMIQFTAAVLAFSSEGGVAGYFKQQLPPHDARTEPVLQLLQDPSGLAVFVLMLLFFLFVVLTILPTLGGVLGAKLLAREQ